MAACVWFNFTALTRGNMLVYCSQATTRIHLGAALVMAGLLSSIITASPMPFFIITNKPVEVTIVTK